MNCHLLTLTKKSSNTCWKTTPKKSLVQNTLTEFANETASESPAPGGGSISAYVGSLGVSLGVMVANLSAHKKGWDDKIDFFSDWAEKGQTLKDELLRLVDADTNAFKEIMDAFALPKSTDEEKAQRKQAIHDATKGAIEVPMAVMRTSFEAMSLLLEMVKSGNPNSVTDGGVGALCCVTAIRGAFMNVKINCKGFSDVTYVQDVVSEGEKIVQQALMLEEEIEKIVSSLLDQ